MSVDVSVVITNHNNSAYIGRAIRSCLKQSLPKEKYEVIVVDDASTDQSNDVIHTFGDRVIHIPLDRNVGVAEASNEGIRRAVGTFVVRVDSDDFISEHSLLFLSEILLNNPDIGFVYSDHIRVDKEERHLERVDLTTLDRLYRHGAGVMFRKSYLEAIGLYDKNLRNAEDYDLLRRYIKNFNGYHLRLPLYRYRIHDSNMTRDEAGRKEAEERVNQKYENR